MYNTKIYAIACLTLEIVLTQHTENKLKNWGMKKAHLDKQSPSETYTPFGTKPESHWLSTFNDYLNRTSNKKLTNTEISLSSLHNSPNLVEDSPIPFLGGEGDASETNTRGTVETTTQNNASRGKLFTPRKMLRKLKQNIETQKAGRFEKNRADKPKNPKTFQKNCGIDNSPFPTVQEGATTIEDYPWLGWLYYPFSTKISSTVVVLVHKQLVIASAMHIHKLPKTDFREKSKVVLGHNCSGPRVGVLTYNYHPEYSAGTYSALVLIQLDLRGVRRELRPICAPPKTFTESIFHTTVLPDDCSRSKIMIYEMEYVSPDECRQFYRRTGLDIATLWPARWACGRARTAGRCVWRAGAALAVRQHHRWHLLGFGVEGPGCGAPARFVDYGRYHPWVADSAARAGRPAVTRLATNHLVLRRSLTHIQRFGPCDREETQMELFTDLTKVKLPEHKNRAHIRYNLTILANVDYSCVAFRASYDPHMAISSQPRIVLRRFCHTPAALGCYDAGLLQIDFYIDIFYFHEIMYKLSAYGKEWKVVDAKALTRYTNEKKSPVKIRYRYNADRWRWYYNK